MHVIAIEKISANKILVLADIAIPTFTSTANVWHAAALNVYVPDMGAFYRPVFDEGTYLVWHQQDNRFVEIKEDEMLACHRTPYIFLCPSVRVWKTIASQDSTCLMSLYIGNAEDSGDHVKCL